MHALSVSDGLAKVLTALGSGSLTTVMRTVFGKYFHELGKV